MLRNAHQNLTRWFCSTNKSLPAAQNLTCQVPFVDICELEPRILYSASPLDSGAEPVEHVVDFNELLISDVRDSPEPVDSHAGSTPFQLMPNLDLALDQLNGLDTNHSEPNEILFIASDVERYQEIISSLDLSRFVDVIVLENDSNGIETITESLSGLQDLQAVHIISHGQNGSVQLGTETLTGANINGFESQLSSWQDALGDSADLLIYGCDLAAGESGQRLVETLSAMCDCDVAASNDLTGHADLGGDWELESRVGKIEAAIAVSIDIQHNWLSTLNTYTVTSTADDASVGTLRWAINEANLNSGLDNIDFAIAGTGVHVINLTGSQLLITDAVVLDGTTQSGFTVGAPVIELNGAGVVVGEQDILHVTSSGSTIRGFILNSANDDAIDVETNGGNTIVGNFIGTDASGLNSASNRYGITIRSNGNTVGGVAAADRNVISGNSRYGIGIWGNGNVVVGNSIGVDALGAGDLGNGTNGIALYSGAEFNQIGDVNAGQANIIAFNDDDGVHLSNTGYGNSIRGNSIHSNGSSSNDIGIDLQGDGVSPNDYTTPVADNDNGSNRVQNFPDLANARLVDGDLIIQGEVTGRDSVPYTIDFYASSTTHSTGIGEGEKYLDSTIINTDADGRVYFSHTISAAAASAGEYVSATATHSDGSTSEFSFARQIINSQYSLLLATDADVTNGGTPGIENWGSSQVLEFGGPDSSNNADYRLGNNRTDGTFSSFIDLNNFNGGSNARLDGLHFVRSDITVGTGGGTFDLRAGDLLMSISDSSETFVGDSTSISVGRNDVWVYRPASLNNYISGDFYYLLDNPMSSRIDALTLVESAAGVSFADGTSLAQGTFLFATGNGSRDITTYFATSVGLGTTAGNSVQLVDNNSGNLGLRDNIEALAIVENAMELGGIYLQAGDILVSLDGDETLGGNSRTTRLEDIFTIRLDNTEINSGITNGDAFALFDGDDLNLNSNAEGIDAFSLTNFNVNQPPTINDQSMAINENSPNLTSVGFVAADSGDIGEPVGYAIVGGSGATAFSIDNVTGELSVADSFQLDFENNPNLSLNVQVTDAAGQTATGTVTVNLLDLNESPSINATRFQVIEGGRQAAMLTAFDPDLPGDSLSWSLTGLGTDDSQFAINPTTGRLAFRAVTDFESPADSSLNNIYLVSVQVADGRGGTEVQTVSVEVLNVNETPTTTGLADVVVAEDAAPYSFDLPVNFGDPEQPAFGLTFSVVANNNATLFDSIVVTATDRLVLSFAKDQFGSATLTVRATDSGGLYIDANLAVSVSPVNDAPVGRSDTYNAVSGFEFNGTGLLDNDFDVDSVNLSASLLRDATNGSVTLNRDGSFTYHPRNNFAGPDSFSYVVSDGAANSDPVTVFVNVGHAPASDLPIRPAPPKPVETNSDDDDSETTEDIPILFDVPNSATNSGADDRNGNARQFSDFGENDDSVITNRETGGPQFVKVDLSALSLPSDQRAPTEAPRVQEIQEAETEETTTDQEFHSDSGWLWEALDEYGQRLEAESNLPRVLLGGSAALASSASIGYVIWFVRGGQILAAVMANVPAWRLIDPLPILTAFTNEERNPKDVDSLQTLIEKGENELDRPKSNTQPPVTTVAEKS